MYGNAKNATISYIYFELNCGYNCHIFFKKNIDCYFSLKNADKFIVKLLELLVICRNNFYHAQKL